VKCVGGISLPVRSRTATTLDRGCASALRRAAAVALLIALSACSRNDPPPIDNAFCRLYVRLPDPSDAVHMKKRENKLAILTNEQTWLHECGHAGSLKKGPI
jgi:hypothetical protein